MSDAERLGRRQNGGHTDEDDSIIGIRIGERKM